MKKSFFNKYIGLGVIMSQLIVAGCSEIFETDIRQDKVILLTPADSSVSIKLSQTFRWEALAGAEKYRLQIASPSIDNPANYFADTTTTLTSLRLSLPVGRFEWRIRALNEGYETAYQSRKFRIDSTSDLSTQEVILLSPVNGQTIIPGTVVFRWEQLPMADQYIFEIPVENIKDTILSNTYIRAFDTEKSYAWQVTATNKKSHKISVPSTFTIKKQTDPVTLKPPTLISPASDATFLQGQTISFTWQRNITNPRNDTLFLYSSNQTTLAINPIRVDNTTYSLGNNLLLNQGTYYWGIKSVDTQGRTSSLSEKRRFIVF